MISPTSSAFDTRVLHVDVYTFVVYSALSTTLVMVMRLFYPPKIMISFGSQTLDFPPKVGL